MITDDTAWLLVEACRVLDLPMRGLTVCELGNQHSGWKLRTSVKSIMQWLGANHTSIDLNGQDGAEVFDLSKALPDGKLGQYDLVTNAGTTEHVCTSGDLLDQWQVFKTIHELSKPTAAMMHVIPNEKGAHGGCGYVYRHTFLPSLALACGYGLVRFFESRSDPNHMAALLLKLPASRFVAFDTFKALRGIVRVSDGTTQQAS